MKAEDNIKNVTTLEEQNKLIIETEQKFKSIISLQKLNKSKFYNKDNELIEHIANFKGYSIFVNHKYLGSIENTENTKNTDNLDIKLKVIRTKDLKYLKKINDNTIKKINPVGLSDIQRKMILVDIAPKIDNIIKNHRG